ncbi:MAG: Na+/H+ antiporter NhaC family protein [Acidobacteriota bacterium]
MQDQRIENIRLWQAVLPVLFLLSVIVYGLILRPRLFGMEPLQLEIVFIFAAVFTIIELRFLGFSWEEVLKSITDKLSQALPAFFILFAIGIIILFAIGIIISSWIVSGTIPMLVYYGIKLIHPTIFYLLAFLVPVIFSTMTGTSYGAIGTIGVVFIGVAKAVGADLGITAGAIVGGAYFGDKISPLSDTTNLAALAVEINLYDHIRSMMYTTFPSFLLAAAAYTILGFSNPPASTGGGLETAEGLLAALEGIFRFNPLLLIPPVVVLWGSFKKMPVIPVLMSSVFSACLLALFFQQFSFTDIMTALNTGFNVDMAPWVTHVPEHASLLLNRGGLYELVEPIIIAFIVFIFIGALDHIRAMPIIVDRLLRSVKSRAGTILASLVSTGITNSMTSNQYATSFIVGDAFKERYDRMGIPRKVLSRSIEDYGTMLESIVPWTTTSIFIVATLGVPHSDYWHWQLISLINLVIAPLLAITGIGCYLPKKGIAGGREGLSKK